MLQEAIKKLVEGENLTENEVYLSIDEIMSGEALPFQVGAFLTAMRMKGETVEEITGAAKAMRDKALPLKLSSEYVIDTCGTGGDGGKTFNISTAVAIIAATAGVKVAKHGNRAVSSQSGSADVLLQLGFNIEVSEEKAKKLIDENGMAFLFAQKYHSAMKNVGPIRKELGIRTIFNLLGPLTNPAFTKGQVLGVYSKELTHPLAQVLLKLGVTKAMVVHGEDGLDEISTTAVTYVSEIKDGEVIDYEIDPTEYGIPKANSTDIAGGTAKENAEIIIDIFKGKKSAKRDIVVINSAAALYVGKVVDNLSDGIKLSEELLDNGAVYGKLHELIKCSNEN
jgi:anthranilate phosphoribosyltransferase